MNRAFPAFATNSGEFLSWWFLEPRLDKKAENILRRYYANYSGDFNDYLKYAWTDRHKELDRELGILKEKPGANVLDLGCGTGSVSLYMACVLEGKGSVLGVDINNERLFCAEERRKVLEKKLGIPLDCEFSELSISSLPTEKKFDLIYLEEAFHHMEPRVEVVRDIASLLNDSGVLIVSEVNAYNPFMQLHLFSKRGLRTIEKRMDDDGHEYLYGAERILTAGSMMRLFEKQGLNMKSLRYFRVASTLLSRIMGYLNCDLTVLERNLMRVPFISHIMAIHYNLVLRKGHTT